jgi:penicillin-insensitive murein endopeptidase
MMGRTYVHSTVHDIILDSYNALIDSMPDTVFVLGETGSENGGPFDPHKTHQNGLSVDFMVPVLNSSGESVPLPTSMVNRWGYDLEFDDSGRLDDLRIDYEAIAEHIYQLHLAAVAADIEIWRVIFDPDLQPHLHETDRWPYLRKNIEFSKKRSWVRHDEHYHVDFRLDCDPAA